MKFIFTAVAVLSLSIGSLATAHETATKKKLLEIDEIAGGEVGNGWSAVSELKEKSYDQRQQIAKIKKEVPGPSDCEMVTVVGRRNNFKSLYSGDIADLTKLTDKLYALHKEKKIKSILSRQWDGASGDSEYCSIYEFRVFSTDGHVLTMHFDLTD